MAMPTRSGRSYTNGVDIPDDSGDTRQASASPRDDANIFVLVLAGLALPVRHVVEVGNSFTEGLDTRRGRVFERVLRERDAGWARRGIWDLSDFRRALTKVSPLVRGGVGEAVGHGTVGAVDDTGATGVLDSGNGLFIRVHGLGENACGTRLGFVTCRLTEYLSSRSARCDIELCMVQHTLCASESFSWR